LRALATLAELRRELELFNREQVKRGLAAGESFADVARALGVSRQAAHRRYRDLAPAHGPRVTVTEPARRVLRLAREEALATQAAALGSEHVLIAVLRCNGDAAEALVREGATLARVRARSRALTAAGERPLSPDASEPGLRGVLREATQRAIARGERLLDVDALLLAALADPEGGARRVLTALGADVAAIRGRLAGKPDPGHAPAQSAAATAGGLSDAA
jgi:hypothetical protein